MKNQFEHMERVNNAIAEYVFYRGCFILSYSVDCDSIKIKIHTGREYNETIEFYRVEDLEFAVKELKNSTNR